MPPAGQKPDHLLAPSTINHTWHLDLATLRVLWFRFTIAALMDGYSRKQLALQVFRGSTTSRDAIRLVEDAIERYGRPKFLITDHGCQFRKVFRQVVEATGTRLGSFRI